MAENPREPFEGHVNSAETRVDNELLGLRTRSHALANSLLAMQGQLGDISTKLTRLDTVIPDDLLVRLVAIEMTLEHMHATIKEDYVKRPEWEVLRTEHDQIKRIVYGTVATLLTGILAALFALVVKK